MPKWEQWARGRRSYGLRKEYHPCIFCFRSVFPLRERSFAEAFVVVVAQLVVRMNGLYITNLRVGISMRAYDPLL